MRCPSCGNENREGAKFCDSCGTALETPAHDEAQASPPSPDEPGVRAGPEGLAPPEHDGDLPDALGSGRYRVESFLGRGGRKRVYLARDASEDRDVAVAVFDTEGVEATVLARARREAQAMGKLGDHPHIVSVYDTGEEDGHPYIVSRYLPGGDVEGLLEAAPDRRLEVDRAVA